MGYCSLKFPLASFPLKEYRRDMSLDECLTTSIELLVPLIVLKKFWEQVLIQIKGRETRKDIPTKQISHNFLSSCTKALRIRQFRQ